MWLETLRVDELIMKDCQEHTHMVWEHQTTKEAQAQEKDLSKEIC